MLENLFQLKEHKTTVKTEIRAGIATFLTMAYIIFVNPDMLSNIDGMPFAGVLFATVMVSAIASILMGLFTNLPFALAPGMGINAFFTYNLVIYGPLEWETALGAVFISGLVFILLSLFKVREMIVAAIPPTLRYSVAAGIGLFLSFIGLKNAGFVVGNPATLVAFGGMNIGTGLFVIGLMLTSILVIKKVNGALIYGILTVSVLAVIATLLGWVEGIVFVPEAIFAMPSLELFLAMDVVGALSLGVIMPVFTLLFTDMFDSISTFVGVAEVGGFMDEETKQPKNVGRALLVDAIATTISGIFGTSSGTTYIESAAGVEEGGRTGLTAVVTGLLFLPFIFLAPLVGFIPSVATAPVLVLVGLFMIHPVLSIKWDNFEESIPAFLAMLLIPLTFNITQGIVWGFLSYTIIKVFRGKFREIPPMLWIVDVFAVMAVFFAH
ncbi:NCS2 family permease [Spirochaeta dissipatitropha]